jgi:spore coat protein U-like protein
MMQRLALAVLFLFAFAVRSAEANSCSAYASSIAFGSFSGTTIHITGSVTVTCTSGQAYNIGLNAGLASGATVTTRSMQSASILLGYQLFSNAAYTSNWGNSVGTSWVSGTGNGSAQVYTIYAQVPAGEYSPVGSYTDTITASISGTGIATATAQFSVTATVAKACSVSTTNMAFGAYAGALLQSTSSITVTCTSTTTYTVGLNAGTASGATVTTRSMQNGSVLLGYKLFSNSGRTTNWGNSSGSWVSGTGSGIAQPLTVYGQIPAGESANPGSYTDTITATLTY